MKLLIHLTLLLGLNVTAHAAEKVIIAHRGASGYLPEHTLPAKALAHAMGADYLEQDIVLSKDNVPVVLHDIHLDTVTDVAERFPGRQRDDGRYYALDFTVAEIKQLRATERFSEKTGKAVYPDRFPVGKSWFTVPTLEEELQFIESLNRTTGRKAGIYPEIKQPAWHRKEGRDISRVVVPILQRFGYRTKADPCYLQCFEHSEVKRLREELGWQGRLIQLTGTRKSPDGTDFARLLTAEGLAELARVADGIGPDLQQVVTERKNGGLQVTGLVKHAHAAGLAVHPYTVRADALPKYVSSVEELYRALLVVADADGVFTDFPDSGVAFLRSNP